MKKIIVVPFIAILWVICMTCQTPVFAGTAEEDLADTYENTQAFDGGPGSALNVSPAAMEEQK